MPRVADLGLRDQPGPKIVKLSNHPSPRIKTPHRDVPSPPPMPVMMVSRMSRTGGRDAARICWSIHASRARQPASPGSPSTIASPRASTERHPDCGGRERVNDVPGRAEIRAGVHPDASQLLVVSLGPPRELPISWLNLVGGAVNSQSLTRSVPNPPGQQGRRERAIGERFPTFVAPFEVNSFPRKSARTLGFSRPLTGARECFAQGDWRRG